MSKLQSIFSITRLALKPCNGKRFAGNISGDRLKELETAYARFCKTRSKSLLKKHLTKSVFNNLKCRQTSFNSSLLDCVQSGFANPDSNVGLYAPDAEAYTVFAELFDKVIKDYHNGFSKSNIQPFLDFGKIECLKDLDPEKKYVVSVRIRCGRSLHGYPFNPCLKEHQYREIEDIVTRALSCLKNELKGEYYPLCGMDGEFKKCLIQNHFLFKDGDRFLKAAQALRFWPLGRGIYFNDDMTFLVWVNEEDHIRIISMQKGGDIHAVYSRLVDGVKSLGSLLQFSRHKRLGFLTFCPTNLVEKMGTKVKLQCKGKCSLQAAPDAETMEKMENGIRRLIESDSKSLLAKHLTREIFDKIKLRRTSFGSTLLDCIQSGLENLDSGVGIYAPDAEAYRVFAEIFDPIIDDYHNGFKPTDRHPKCDFGDVGTLINVDPTAQYVVSVRVRCGRSLTGYPFNPCLKEEEYKDIEKKVIIALGKLQGELMGQYQPLTGMDKKIQKNLIDTHYLFKEGDRFLIAANACRYWPSGRGIFFNEKRTFVVWINEEDHIRIISMEAGGDLGACYRRFVNGVNTLSETITFSRDDRLGFLTFCPTNLGTTIRASVHIKLPKLSKDKAKFEEVAAKFNLQIRGTTGEHTESIGGVYDISNKQRIGLTEYQAVKTMQDGILEMIKIEQSLTSAQLNSK